MVVRWCGGVRLGMCPCTVGCGGRVAAALLGVAVEIPRQKMAVLAAAFMQGRGRTVAWRGSVVQWCGGVVNGDGVVQ